MSDDYLPELVVDHVEEYRDWHIRLRVHRHGNEVGAEKTATVSVHPNDPTPAKILQVGMPATEANTDRSAHTSWEVDIPPRDSEDVLTGALENAKEWVDTQRTDRYGAKESATIAVERAFSDEGEGGDE